MKEFQKQLRKFQWMKFLASIKITVVGLLLLFILTFWGTIAQIDQGLFLAQERFFNSIYFLALGFIPFPGAQLVLIILFINLCAASLIRFQYLKSNLGILVIHIGLLTYFIAAFVTYHVTEESNLTLLPNEGTNVSQSYHQWELSAWQESNNAERLIYSYDLPYILSNNVLTFDNLNFSLKVKSVFENAKAYQTKESTSNILNASDIDALTKVKFNTEPEKNLPGLILTNSEIGDKQILLYGAESRPLLLSINGKNVNLQLRRKRFELPFVLTLKEFNKELHPNTEVARNYESLVQINHEGVIRDVLIYMNNPLRHKDYTLYQASYSIDAAGNVRSTLAVVKNKGRLLPYIASFLVQLGLIIHFLKLALKPKKKQ